VTATAPGPLVVPDARTDERVCRLPPVTSGEVGAYLGMPLTTNGGQTVGALCVFGPTPREWSDDDIATLRQLAESTVTELELSALVRQYEGDRVRWGLAIDAARIGTFDWDLVSGRLSWDDQLIRLFGYDLEGFAETIEAFNDRLHPDDVERVSEALQQCIDTCGEYDAEYRVVRPDGETRWVHARGRALPGPAGTAVRVLGAAYDTTGELEGATLVTRVLEAMPAGFYSLDREWRFTYVNAEAERLLGSNRDDLIGQVLWEAFPAAVNSIFEESYRSAVRTGQPVSFDAYYPAPLDGWYELRAWPSPDGLSVYFLEVTERRLVQARAERSAQRLAILAQVSTELAGTLDAAAATAHLPRVVVPSLADFCIVTVVDRDGRPRDVGSWHADPSSRAVLARYAAVRLDAMPATSPVARALIGGEPIRENGATVLDLLAPGEARDLLEALEPGTAVVLPLRGRGRILGLLTLYFRPGTAVEDEDLATAQDIADRAGWPWTMRGSTARSSNWRRACSAACSPSRPSPTTRRSRCGTRRPPRPPASGATGTTRSCSRAAPRCWSSATSWATTPRRRQRWDSCAACSGASRPTATPARSRCCAAWTPRWRPCGRGRWPPQPWPGSSRAPTSSSEG
jgi:PAS domain S-box-containing protein